MLNMPIHEAAKKLNETYSAWRAQADPLGSHPARSVLDRVSDKWSLVILITLALRPYRFGELKREIPKISQRMLTETLSGLQCDGLINRTVYPTKPPSVEYSLTPLGESLMIPLWEMVRWANIHSNKIQIAREHFMHNGNSSSRK